MTDTRVTTGAENRVVKLEVLVPYYVNSMELVFAIQSLAAVKVKDILVLSSKITMEQNL